MHRATDQATTTAIPPWKPPADGFERQLRPGRRSRRRLPLTRRQLAAIRTIWVLTAISCIGVLSLGLPATSFWRHEALALPIILIFNLAWFTPYQIGQLLGLRPPSDTV